MPASFLDRKRKTPLTADALPVEPSAAWEPSGVGAERWEPGLPSGGCGRVRVGGHATGGHATGGRASRISEASATR